MKKLFPILCAALMLSASFTLSVASPAAIRSSKISGDERDVKNFTGIAAGGPITVIVKLGNTESLRLEGDADAISTLVSEVKGSILIIRPETSWNSWSKKYQGKKITAYVTAKKITSLTMSGSGSLSVDGTVNSSDLTTTLSGSGQIKVSVNAKDFTSVISGSGNIDITGKADESSLTLSGSGSFNGKSFAVNDFSAVVSGSGTVNIQAERKLNATISGSGNINYSGNASVSKTVVGSGRIHKN